MPAQTKRRDTAPPDREAVPAATNSDGGHRHAPTEAAQELKRLLVRLTADVGGAATWAPADRRDVLQALDRVIDGLVAVRGRVLTAEKAAGTWQGRGDRSFEAWRGRTARTGSRAARVEVRQAEQLDQVPQVGAALTDGRISLEHASTITRIAGSGSPAQQEAVQSSSGQDYLLRLAQRHDAQTFATAAARWAASHDPAGLERDHQTQRANRFVHLVDTRAGTLIKGQLDSLAGYRLRLALEAATPRPAADDERDPGQRTADALDTLATTVLSAKDTTPGAHVPPQVSLLLTEDTWHAARAHLQHRRAAAADTSTGLKPYPPATLEDGTPVPISELAVALCDAEITRIVVDAQGLPTDLGRSTRLFTGPLRRAVIARDRHCAWPDCHAPARWCQIHHIDWWERDHGPTSLQNAVLLCSFHHHEVHRRDLTITRTASAPTDVHTSALATVSYQFRERAAGRPIGAPPATGAPNGPPRRANAGTPSLSRAAPPPANAGTPPSSRAAPLWSRSGAPPPPSAVPPPARTAPPPPINRASPLPIGPGTRPGASERGKDAGNLPRDDAALPLVR